MSCGNVFKHPQYSIGGRLRISALLNDDVAYKQFLGKRVSVAGWIRTVRKQGGDTLLFIVLNDGSTSRNLQVVVESSCKGFDRALNSGTGCSARISGVVVESPAKGQFIEVLLKDEEDEIVIVGGCDQSKYPLAKKQHSKEFLREIAHLRPRTNFFGAVTRVRNAMAIATHAYFQELGFLYVHTPIITSTDCEGAGEMFQVTTLIPEDGNIADIANNKGLVDYSKDFFSKPAFLTVSGQLALENFACSLGDVYTFGPTFRAENSHTSRHLAEFWMIEPEMAFADLNINMKCAEGYLKYCVKWCFENNMPDIEFFDANVENGLINRLKQILEKDFARVSYTEAIELLKKHDGVFKQKVEWGMDLGSEHEKFLTENITNGPTIVYNYPKDIKSFYMKLNDDGKTVAAMDILLPRIGEVVGGSQREDDIEKLDAMIELKGIPLDSYWWYRELRKYGSVPHCGFGLGFERLMMMVTGIENIRDVIPFPRYPSHSTF